jgi:triphosphatase
MEIELKFQVPAAALPALRRAVATKTAQRTRLQALYAETADDRLAAAGLALRLRKEGRAWVQTLKGRGDGLMQRLEHEITLPATRGEPVLDPARHAGTPAGAALQRALQGGAALAPLYRTDIQRLHRVLYSGGARVELALDEGWILAAGQRLPVCEIEFELLAGPPAALVALARRWAARFGLVWDVRTKSERGFRLARGLLQVPATRAAVVVAAARGSRPGKPGKAGALSAPAPTRGQAWSTMLQATLAQALPNAAELAAAPLAPGGGATPDHLHQLRVALRRLRTVLALAADWAPDPAAARALQEAWREPFARLGAARDADVLRVTLWPELAAAGAPPLVLPQEQPQPDPGAVLREPLLTQLFLDSLALSLPSRVETESPPDMPPLAAAAAELLQRAWRQVRADTAAFATLPLEQQHRTRRRLKRLRYAFELLQALPPLAQHGPARATSRWHRRLCQALDALGRYNDLCMADAALAKADDPGAWFARGWLAAQRGPALAAAQGRLQRLLETPRPWARARTG